MSETLTMLPNGPRAWVKVPLKPSLIFNKTKHSKDWHEAIDDIAGVLHPSDPKFPYHLLRQATETYLKKKGKITQADADVRLSALIDTHKAKDIAVAATAHAMTPSSLRALLHADLNVAHGNYWGLDTWLQCLIAANYCNPASVTDLEATWARHLSPFATYGPGAAGKILVGVSRALRECATPNMNIVPEFLVLTIRALVDYAAQLEGLRLKNNWVAAHAASCWMAELGRTSLATIPPGHLLLEQILDAQFPVWRAWANWRPDLRRIALLSSMDSSSAAMLPDLLALEGPDFVSRTKPMLRDGLIEQYGCDKSLVKVGGLLIEVSSRTKDCFREILESAISTLELTWAAVSLGRARMLRFFTELTITRPMTQEALNLVQATLFMQEGLPSGLLDAILLVYTKRNCLEGSHIFELQQVVRLFDHDRASGLRRILLTSTTLQGITRCIQDNQDTIRTLVEQNQPWNEPALRLHEFISTIKSSKSIPVVGEKIISQMCLLLPPTEHMTMAIEIYTAARNERANVLSKSFDDDEITVKSWHPAEGSLRRVASPSFLTGQIEASEHPLEEVIKSYVLHRLSAQQAASSTSQRMFDSILRVWKSACTPNLTQDRRLLAILVTKVTSDDANIGVKCLDGIASADEQLGQGLLLKDVLMVLRGMENNHEQSIVKLITLLAKCSTIQDCKAQVSCWRDLAYHLLAREAQPDIFKDGDLIDFTLRTMGAVEWLSFLTDVETFFVSGPAVPSKDDVVLSVLQPELQIWKSKLVPYTKTLSRLEKALGDEKKAVKYILRKDNTTGENTLATLRSLKLAEGKPVEPFLHKIIGLLSAKADCCREIMYCVSAVAEAPPETLELFTKIWDVKHGYLVIPGLPIRDQQPASHTTKQPSSTPTDFAAAKYDVPPSVVEVMVAGWMLDEQVAEGTKDAIGSIARVLDICQDGLDISKEKLTEAASFWQKIEYELIQEAKRLESLRKGLKAKDPKGTSLLLQEIGMPDTTELDEEILRLPAGVIDLVEKVSHSEVEISFPLDTFTQLQRTAAGVPEGASMLLLRLFRVSSTDLPPLFCLHYNTDLHPEAIAHSRYSCSTQFENPTQQICTSKQTALTWQLSRMIFSKLCKGDTDIIAIYEHVSKWLRDLSQFCVSCSKTHHTEKVRLRRSIPCDTFSCARLWYNLPLHVRIPEIRTDVFAVDMALYSVYAAAMTGKPELLPGCPITNSQIVKSVLNALPPMSLMRDAVDLSSVLRSYHESAEKLISWAVVHHRGFLATATGLLKIPNLPPGTHQFVLANAGPQLENAFMSQMSKTCTDTTVLFHGTSLDRLPCILAQGLRICSGTSFQRSGAAHGKGIYLSDDPATSFYYSPSSLSWKNSGLNGMRVLLGCEVIGDLNTHKVNGKIHVVRNVESVIVRYILMFTRDARMPIRGHIEPAMASGMKALRSGAL